MIDTENLRTASLYINNQLLSRGLLRDGQSIEFANPGETDADTAATMGRVVSVVNDLILRRDRDADHRESLSTTMRSLRAENLKQTTDLSRLSEKHAEAQRRLDMAESSEASLRTQLKSADAAARGLKDDLARTKALVSQARASCATDVRRRDRQIDTLKRQLGEAGRPRGVRANPAVTSIHVAGDVGGERDRASSAGGSTTAAEDYDLRSETNAFLAELAKNLSEENEALLKLMRRAMEQLREMSGWNGGDRGDAQVDKQPGWEDMASDLDSIVAHMRTILTNPSFVPIEEVEVREEEITRLKDGWVKMEARWQEAVRLIDGWRKRMAASGTPICDEELKMGLRLSPVRVRDVEETDQADGLGFGLSAVAEEPEDDGHAVQSSPCPPAQDPTRRQPADSCDGQGNQEESDGESSGYDDDMAADDYDKEEPNVEILQQSAAPARPSHDSSRDSSPLPEPPQLSPLKNSASAGNRGAALNSKTRQKAGDFTTIVEENTRDVASASGEPPQPPPHRTRLASQPTRPSLATGKTKDRTRSPSRTSLEEALLPEPAPKAELDAEDGASKEDDEVDLPQLPPAHAPGEAEEYRAPSGTHKTPRPAHSRLPLPRNADPPQQQSPLTMATIAAKLAASEREADAARVRAKIKAARGPRGGSGGVKRPAAPAQAEHAPAASEEAGQEQAADVDPVKHDLPPPPPQESEQQPKPEKRKRERRTSKAASRRRSTLSPWELESLMSGQVQ